MPSDSESFASKSFNAMYIEETSKQHCKHLRCELLRAKIVLATKAADGRCGEVRKDDRELSVEIRKKLCLDFTSD